MQQIVKISDYILYENERNDLVLAKKEKDGEQLIAIPYDIKVFLKALLARLNKWERPNFKQI